jgi:hypothetical protein
VLTASKKKRHCRTEREGEKVSNRQNETNFAGRLLDRVKRKTKEQKRKYYTAFCVLKQEKKNG